jgi:hypothetical protein
MHCVELRHVHRDGWLRLVRRRRRRLSRWDVERTDRRQLLGLELGDLCVLVERGYLW